MIPIAKDAMECCFVYKKCDGSRCGERCIMYEALRRLELFEGIGLHAYEIDRKLKRLEELENMWNKAKSCRETEIKKDDEVVTESWASCMAAYGSGVEFGFDLAKRFFTKEGD